MKIEDFKITLSFTIDELNMIFRFLEKIPYGEVAGLYEEIKKQVDSQLIPPEDFDNNSNTINTESPV